MPQFKTTQNKHKKSKKKGSERPDELILKSNDQDYGYIQDILGGRNANVILQSGGVKLCSLGHIARGRGRICKGDIVLVNFREFQNNKADVIYKYSLTDITKLKKQKEIDFSKYENKDTQNDNDDSEEEVVFKSEEEVLQEEEDNNLSFVRNYDLPDNSDDDTEYIQTTIKNIDNDNFNNILDDL